MLMKIFFCLLFSLLTCPLWGQKTDFDAQTLQALEALDDILERKAEFHQVRSEQISRLKRQAATAQGQNRTALYKEILSLYTHYQTDSAQVYLDCIAQMAHEANDEALQTYVHIAQAEIYSIQALYAEASQELHEVSPAYINEQHPDLRLYYYRTWRTLCGWLANYSKLNHPREVWTQRTALYRDSLILIDKPGESLSIVLADKATSEGNPQRAVELLLPYAEKMDPERPDPYICFTLYEAYTALEKQQDAVKYLILAAKADLQRATTEYLALPLLAQVLYEHGQVERAYNYLFCSMEDANFCKASLRALEISSVFPIIEKQYKEKLRQQHKNERILMYILGGLFLLLCLVVLNLIKQMRRLKQLRQQQAETNEALAEANGKMQEAMGQLKEANGQLQETYAKLRSVDKLKEQYIVRYLDMCRDNLDTLLHYRRTTVRLLKERRLDELRKLASSEEATPAELGKFYADFDEAFLTLFPDFIERFNALLKPEERMVPKHENQLNTELRIFALIRLGVKDANRIAHFLNFSLATIYNYRSKIRNKAIGDPAEFDAKVAEL